MTHPLGWRCGGTLEETDGKGKGRDMKEVKPTTPATAFPLAYRTHTFPGMTLRDWFAGHALPQIIASCKDDTRNPGDTHEQMFAGKAYAIADAMIAAREGDPT